MNKTPDFPIFAINNRGGVIGHKAGDELNRHSLVGICQWEKFETRYFDAKGQIWSAHIADVPYPVNIWTKILGRVYNPWFTVKFAWRTEGTYTLPELQERLCQCVNMDDDILTQFMEADKLKKLIRETKTFEHLFNRMKKMNII